MADDTEPPRTGARRSLDGLFAAMRGLGIERSGTDRWLAGVCSGLANRFGIDPLLARGILIVLIFMGGIGVLTYLVAWALLPDANGRILAEDGLRGSGHGIALLVVIAIVLFSRLGNLWWLWLVLVPVGVLAWWGVQGTRSGKTPEQMSEEASRFANQVAARFSSAPGAAPVPAPQTGSYAAAGTAPVAPPHGMGPGRTGTVVAPDRVIRHRRRRGGLLALLLAAGLVVAGYGIGTVVATDLGFSGRPELVAAGFAVGAAGLALVIVGLTGRRAGFTAFLTVCLALGTIAVAAMPTFPGGGYGDRTWKAAPAARQFTLTAGDATLALDDATNPVTVAMGAGQLTITVPRGTTAQVTTNVRVGQVVVRHADGTKEQRGGAQIAPDRIYTVGTGATVVPVDARLVLGEIVIVEAS